MSFLLFFVFNVFNMIRFFYCERLMIKSDILEGVWSCFEVGKRREGELFGIIVLVEIFIERGYFFLVLEN